VLDLIPDATPCDLPRDVFVKLTGSGRLWGFPLTGYRCAVDSPERLQAASEALSEGRCGLKPLT
jgi:mannose-1-phosphate guanylyltransferase/phosphomannomutase